MNKNKIKILLKSLFFLLTFAVAIQVSAIWINPPAGTPPANNIPPPVNTGIDPQMKNGAFGAQGIRAVGPLGLGLFDVHVGIGTDSPGVPHMPTQPLDVVGNVKFSGALMPASTSFPAGNPGVDGQFLKSKGPNVPPEWATGSGGGDTFWSRTGAAPYYTYLTNSGDKVGIGLSNPSQQLELTGSFELPITTNATTGVVYKATSRFMHDYGSGNTFLGTLSGNFSMTGANNSAFGASTLFSNNAGYENVAFGTNSLYSNVGGYRNVALGSASLGDNTSGYENVAIGKSSLDENISGHNNVGVGRSTLGYNDTGTYNTAIGSIAGNKNDNSDFNVFVGAEADFCVVSGCTSSTNSSWDYNTAIGYQAKISSPAATTVRTNATALGYGAISDASNKVRIGNTAVTVIQGQVNFTAASDSRFKKNIQDIDLGLDFINNLHPVSYQMKNDVDDGLSYGFIAQEVEKVLGDRNTKMISRDNTTEAMMSMRYNDLMAPMVKAIQEQQEQIEELKKEIEILKNK